MVLIIDDEESIIQVLKDKFEQENFYVLTASDGKKGLEFALNHQPDIILLDIIMPEMDGLTMLAKLRKDKRGKDTHVIILTNLSQDFLPPNSNISQASDYLIKANWKIGDVVKVVKKTLKSNGK